MDGASVRFVKKTMGILSARKPEAHKALSGGGRILIEKAVSPSSPARGLGEHKLQPPGKSITALNVCTGNIV